MINILMITGGIFAAYCFILSDFYNNYCDKISRRKQANLMIEIVLNSCDVKEIQAFISTNAIYLTDASMISLYQRIGELRNDKTISEYFT